MKLYTKILAATIVIASTIAAVADYAIKDGNGSSQTVFAFVCFTTKICPASVPITSAGVEIVQNANGQAVSANSAPVVIASDQSALPITPSPSAVAAIGITPIVSTALESNHVIKASAGNLYTGYVTTTTIGGYLLVANSTTAPTAGGAAIAPLACVVAPAGQSVSISTGGGPPIVASTGITLVFSTSGCFTNTASATAYFSGMAK